MDVPRPNLGLCYFKNQLFYAVNDIYSSKKLVHIGCVDFNFNLADTLLSENETELQGLQKTVKQLEEEYDVNHVRALSFPSEECWTILPKLVYDNADEREAYISVLMNGVERKQIQPTWFSMSNQSYRFLVLRDTRALKGLQQILPSTSSSDLVSEFELGERWVRHRSAGGSFMNICCFDSTLSVSSYILGKLRGATCIPFDDAEDLPYLWLQHARELGWMNGLHEQINVYGQNAFRIIEILEPFWDDAGAVVKMDSLEKIKVEAEEQTYGFSLEHAYPAIMLALGP